MMTLFFHRHGMTGEELAPLDYLRNFKLDGDEKIWLDFEDPTEDEQKLLSEVFHFHPLAIEDCIAVMHHPKLDLYEGYIYLVLHGINFNLAHERFATHELDVFLGPTFLVTYHKRRMRSIAAAREDCRKTGLTMARGLDFLVHTILDRMVDNYFPVLQMMEKRIEAIEAQVVERPSPEILKQIFKLKRELLWLKRVSFPQRDVILRLYRDDSQLVSPQAQLYFRDIYDHLYRMTEIADSYRDMTMGVLDAYLTSVSNRMNEIMKVLTIFASIMLPLTLIAGIYGMNFENMPELKWHNGYYYVLAGMGVLALVMLIYFKKKKWM